MAIVHRVPARVGLLGNPSDGYYGKTLSFALHNFYAEVTLTPSERLCFQPHPVHDPLEFESLEKLADRVASEGYYGGMRLLMAICAHLHAHCAQHNIFLPNRGNFTLSYTTNIPRQAGLSGSSAIVCAALDCLLQFFDISNQIRLVDRPGLVLGAETELGITAGLQDRVIQVYRGLVYMDFDEELMLSSGHGNYTPLDPSILPRLQIIYARNPSDSGKVHSTVRKRWGEGDLELKADMDRVAQLAEEGKQALEQGDHTKLAYLMDKNFDLRRFVGIAYMHGRGGDTRKMFGDDALGVLNIEMVATARSVGAAAKFTGSGGAIVAFCPMGGAQIERLKAICIEKDFVVIDAAYKPDVQT